MFCAAIACDRPNRCGKRSHFKLIIVNLILRAREAKIY